MFNLPKIKLVLGPKEDAPKVKVPNMGGCIVTNKVAETGKIHFMYRNYPVPDKPDSGWRFFSGVEDEDYIANPTNSKIYAVDTITASHPDTIPFLQAPYQSAFEKNLDGKFVQVFDFDFGGDKLTLKKALRKGKNELEISKRTVSQAPQFGVPELDEYLKKYNGIKAYDGWIRILGGKSKFFKRNIEDWNRITNTDTEKKILVADDVTGGFWAIDRTFNGIEYLAPDTLEWEKTNLTFFGFLEWVSNGPFPLFYKKYLWRGCGQEVKKIKDDQTYAYCPFAFTDEFDIKTCRKAIVPIKETWDFSISSIKQLKKIKPGQQFQILIKN